MKMIDLFENRIRQAVTRNEEEHENGCVREENLTISSEDRGVGRKLPGGTGRAETKKSQAEDGPLRAGYNLFPEIDDYPTRQTIHHHQITSN